MRTTPRVKQGDKGTIISLLEETSSTKNLAKMMTPYQRSDVGIPSSSNIVGRGEPGRNMRSSTQAKAPLSSNSPASAPAPAPAAGSHPSTPSTPRLAQLGASDAGTPSMFNRVVPELPDQGGRNLRSSQQPKAPPSSNSPASAPAPAPAAGPPVLASAPAPAPAAGPPVLASDAEKNTVTLRDWSFTKLIANSKHLGFRAVGKLSYHPGQNASAYGTDWFSTEIRGIHSNGIVVSSNNSLYTLDGPAAAARHNDQRRLAEIMQPFCLSIWPSNAHSLFEQLSKFFLSDKYVPPTPSRCVL